jgi:hypothetical protein
MSLKKSGNIDGVDVQNLIMGTPGESSAFFHLFICVPELTRVRPIIDAYKSH